MAVLSVIIAGVRGVDRKTERTFTDALDMIRNVMQSVELTGNYSLIPRQKTAWRPKRGETMCLRPSQGRELKIRIRPGNNDSTWEYSLIGEGNIDMEAVRVKLEYVLGEEFIEGNHEMIGTVKQPAAKPPEPAAPVDPMAAFAKMQRALERRAERQGQVVSLRESMGAMDKQIAQLKDRRTELELQMMQLEEEIANDPDAQTADKFVALLSTLK